jgi:hypothetical protein
MILTTTVQIPINNFIFLKLESFQMWQILTLKLFNEMKQIIFSLFSPLLSALFFFGKFSPLGEQKKKLANLTKGILRF